jgi:hypothetical protein
MFKFTRWFLTHFFVLSIVVSSAHAQATRTWVSGVGDDANPCSRTAPCKTFAGAISKTAASGEINVMDPGGFGAVTITKALTIDGSGGSIAGILVPGTYGITVSAGTGDAVVLRNLDIDGTGTGTNGIVFNSGKSLRVENTKIYGFQNGIDFAPTGTSTLLIEKTDVHDNSSAGLYVNPGGGSAHVTVIDSTFSNNLYGIEASGAGAVVYISGITVTHNSVGIVTTSGGGVWAQGNNRIMNNTSDGSPTGYLPQYSGTLVIY